MLNSKRPVYLNLFRLRFPITAVMSMGHRISGVLLFLALPLLLYALQQSLAGPDAYGELLATLHRPVWQLVMLAPIWAFSHHLLAGIRFLLADLDVAMSRSAARFVAWLVHGLVVLLMAVLIMVLL